MILPVSEVIALKLRRPNMANQYLYVQIFAGVSGVIGSLCLLELWRVIRKRKDPAEESSFSTVTQGEVNGAEK
jgi:hypothetical protein